MSYEYKPPAYAELNRTAQMINGERVEVLVHGDEEWYAGTVIRARKMWVSLDDYPWYSGFIADENSIKDWRRPSASAAR